MANANTTSLPEETWKPIPGWEGYYSVSDHGRVRSERRTVKTEKGQRTFRPQLIKQAAKDSGHLQVGLYKNGKGKTRKVHQLVMEAFVGPIGPGHEIRHLNGDPTDNRVGNLAFGTRSENTQDSVRHGTHNRASVTHCPHGHILAEPNLIRSLWRNRKQRNCLACGRARGIIRYRMKSHPDFDHAAQFNQIADSYYLQIMQSSS